MLSIGARFPTVRHVLGGARCGGRRGFPNHKRQSVRKLAHIFAPHKFQFQRSLNSRIRPILCSPLKNTMGFSTTSHSIEKADGVSESNISNTTESTGLEVAVQDQQAARLAVFRRLYRILYRRINQLENVLLLQQQQQQQQQQHAVDSSSSSSSAQDDSNDSDHVLFLLQPPLNPHCVGSSRIIDNISNASVPQVLNLFYHWSLFAMGGSLDDNDDENENKKKDLLEERFTNWLNAVCPNFHEEHHESANTMHRRRHQYPWQENRALDTLWVRIPVLRQALRSAFSASVSLTNDDVGDNDGDKTNRQFNIQASIQAYKFLSQQLAMIPLTSTSTTAFITTTTARDDDETTITTYDSDKGTFITRTLTSNEEDEEERLLLEINKLVRVTAVSRWIGRSLNPSQRRTTTTTSTSNTGIASSNQYDHQFVYRIRIENLTKSEETESTKASRSSSSGGGGTTVQLNGRSWEIESLPLHHDTDNKEDGRSPKSKNKEEDYMTRDIVKVHAPREGAVGQHPLLGPEQAFEYYSRCDLSTPIGTMQGRFYFTIISSSDLDDEYNDDDKKTGNNKEAVKNRHFQVQVHPFSLRAERF